MIGRVIRIDKNRAGRPISGRRRLCSRVAWRSGRLMRARCRCPTRRAARFAFRGLCCYCHQRREERRATIPRRRDTSLQSRFRSRGRPQVTPLPLPRTNLVLCVFDAVPPLGFGILPLASAPPARHAVCTAADTTRRRQRPRCCAPTKDTAGGTERCRPSCIYFRKSCYPGPFFFLFPYRRLSPPRTMTLAFT